MNSGREQQVKDEQGLVRANSQGVAPDETEQPISKRAPPVHRV